MQKRNMEKVLQFEQIQCLYGKKNGRHSHPSKKFLHWSNLYRLLKFIENLGKNMSFKRRTCTR